MNPGSSNSDVLRSADPVQVAAEVGKLWRERIPGWAGQGRDVAPLLFTGLARLSSTRLWGAANREPSFAMWREAGSILEKGWLQLRAREKPRGYAGDHQMLGAIYQNRVTNDPLGAVFDRYFLAQAAPAAVRNRMRLVRDLLVAKLDAADRVLKIVVIGSGSALEIADALQIAVSRPGHAHDLLLLDLDPAALEEAEKNLRPSLGNVRLECRTENLARLPTRSRNAACLLGADLLICTGFFDYLDDQAAVEMLRLYWQSLSSNGQALIFNFAPWNPTRAFMEWIGNWYLIYRTRADLASLANRAAIEPANYEITAEETGIDLLLNLQRHENSGTARRHPA